MAFAFVTTNLLDMRARPGFVQERVNQLFYGQTVEVFGRRSGYVRVKATDDGYTGWVDERFLKPVGRVRAGQYNESLNGLVKANAIRLSGTPHLLFYGTPLRCLSVQRGIVTCSLPDQTRFPLSASAVIKPERITRKSISGVAVTREAEKFLGVPYLWGGVSSGGFDCSGFVRTIFSRFGLHLPRDTKDQIRVGSRIEREDIVTGDLLFFQRHVGIAMGRKQLIHASLGGSGVRINALSPDGPDYRADLDHTFAHARRLL